MMIHKHYKLSIDAWWPFIVLKTIPEQFNNVHWLFTNVCFWGGFGCRVFIYKQKWWSKLCLFNVSDMWIQYLWMFSGINKHSKGIYFLGAWQFMTMTFNNHFLNGCWPFMKFYGKIVNNHSKNTLLLEGSILLHKQIYSILK